MWSGALVPFHLCEWELPLLHKAKHRMPRSTSSLDRSELVNNQMWGASLPYRMPSVALHARTILLPSLATCRGVLVCWIGQVEIYHNSLQARWMIWTGTRLKGVEHFARLLLYLQLIAGLLLKLCIPDTQLMVGKISTFLAWALTLLSPVVSALFLYSSDDLLESFPSLGCRQCKLRLQIALVWYFP